jgi:hypothetical protein
MRNILADVVTSDDPKPLSREGFTGPRSATRYRIWNWLHSFCALVNRPSKTDDHIGNERQAQATVQLAAAMAMAGISHCLRACFLTDVAAIVELHDYLEWRCIVNMHGGLWRKKLSDRWSSSAAIDASS